mgnify:CR=1 FL=1
MKAAVKLNHKKDYIAPDIKIIEIVTDQHILAGGSAPNMPGEDW